MASVRSFGYVLRQDAVTARTRGVTGKTCFPSVKLWILSLPFRMNCFLGVLNIYIYIYILKPTSHLVFLLHYNPFKTIDSVILTNTMYLMLTLWVTYSNVMCLRNIV